MLLESTRLGTIASAAGDLLLFPEGLIGFEQLHVWALLKERSLLWLQAIEDSQVALPLVSPFDYVLDYQLRLEPDDCGSFELGSPEQLVVLAVLGEHDRQWTLNLRAPILIQPDLRLGCQVVAGGENSLRHVLPRTAVSARKSA
jgi:flagellar assembly factor FliW